MKLRTSPFVLPMLLFAVLSSGCESDSASVEANNPDPAPAPSEQAATVLGDITLDYDEVVQMLFNQEANDDPPSIDGLILVRNDN
ncbi:MAG: hypothetical protein AB8B79_19005 [Granulosicoccus sp.]